MKPPPEPRRYMPNDHEAAITLTPSGSNRRCCRGLAQFLCWLCAGSAGGHGGLVPHRQVLLSQALGTPNALGHLVTGQLDVDATGMGSEVGVHLEETLEPRSGRRRNDGSCVRSLR